MPLLTLARGRSSRALHESSRSMGERRKLHDVVLDELCQLIVMRLYSIERDYAVHFQIERSLPVPDKPDSATGSNDGLCG